MNIIMLGAPGSGKGTMAKQIVRDFDIPQISTGDIFRENIKNQTELGKQVKEIMDKGELVPDKITIELVKQRINKDDCQNGFILDGFPRNIVQAKELEKFAKIDKVIFLDASYDLIEKRLSGRRTCGKCGEIFNISTHNEPTCSKCGGKLVQRDDDKIEAIRKRLEVYEKQTAPLINFYNGKIFTAEAEGDAEETYEPVKIELSMLVD